jgi:hypothetical protein
MRQLWRLAVISPLDGGFPVVPNPNSTGEGVPFGASMRDQP